MPRRTCKVCRKSMDVIKHYYSYSYVRAGVVVRKRMSICKICLKIQRIRRSMASET